MNQVSSHLYLPQVPPLHLGIAPEQAATVPHLHTPESQVSDVSEQGSLVAHLHTPESQVSDVPEQSVLVMHSTIE